MAVRPSGTRRLPAGLAARTPTLSSGPPVVFTGVCTGSGAQGRSAARPFGCAATLAHRPLAAATRAMLVAGGLALAGRGGVPLTLPIPSNCCSTSVARKAQDGTRPLRASSRYMSKAWRPAVAELLGTAQAPRRVLPASSTRGVLVGVSPAVFSAPARGGTLGVGAAWSAVSPRVSTVSKAATLATAALVCTEAPASSEGCMGKPIATLLAR